MCSHVCACVCLCVYIYIVCIVCTHMHVYCGPEDVYMKMGPVGEAVGVCCGWGRCGVQYHCKECEWYVKGVSTIMGRFQNC